MSADDRPRGSCLVDGCSRDPYPRDDGRVPRVCGPDVSRMRTWLREVPQLVDELAGGGFVMRDQVGERLEKLTEDGGRAPVARYGQPPARLAAKEPDHPLVLRAGQPVEHRDLVANLLPAGPISGSARGGQVSGSSEPRLPIATDAVDLLAPARSLRRLDDEDQVGFLPVASTLDFWVQDLRDHRARGEGLPEPSVTVLARWLLERIDAAADDWLPVDEFFDDLRRAHGALRGQLGLVDVPDYKPGIPCSKCGVLALVRQPGSDRIECGSCRVLLTIPEYEEYVLTLSTVLTAEEREKRKKATAERRALWRLIRVLREVGWRHAVDHQVDHDPETGAPEPYRTHRWTRGEESIELDRHGGRLAGYLLYRPHPDADAEEMVCLGVGWLAVHRVKRLTSVALAAGVLDPAGWG